MRILLFIYFLLLYVSSAHAQPSFEWARNKSFSLNSYGWSISNSKDNEVFVSGSFTGPYHHPDSTDIGGFILKYDSAGNLKWQKIFYSKHKAIRVINTVDKAGNVFVTGNFNGNMQYENSMFTGGGMYFMKYDPNGNLLFSKRPCLQAVPYEICINQNDEIYIAGYCWRDSLFEGHTMQKEAFIAKYSSDGTFLWVKEFFCPTTSETNFDMCLDKDGNIYTTGDFYGFPYITDSVQIATSGNADGYIIKYDPNANLKWVKTIKGLDHEQPKAIRVNNKGEIFIGGNYGAYEGSSVSCFDTISVTSPMNCSSDLFVAKYDSLGNCQWVKTAGSNGVDILRGLYADNNGNVFATGCFASYGGGNAVFDTQTIYSTNPYGPDMFLANYNTDGNLKWVKGSSGGGGHGIDLVGNNRSDLYVTGAFGGNFNFGSFSLIGNDQVFLFKIKYDTAQASIDVNELSGYPFASLLVYPNPTNGAFHINYSTTEKSKFKLNVVNLRGQVIYTETISHFEGEYHKTFDLGKHSEGIYFIEIFNGKNKVVKRIVLK
ncbi:MAG: T9SS type A sorting domain-containing protein [Bacteroidetes bacterium]|nr:T9SS type A sorting domain-containing protein [Bacteroidota bacterium]HET6243808.1 T9SS type A sorting domain-containing protein [Bacteroidia bacterium]